MDRIRKILTVLFLTMAALIAVGLALPGTWIAERTVYVEAAPEDVYDRIVDLEAWPTWAIWFEQDPDMHTTFSDPPSGAGAWYEWSGNRFVGEGRLDLTAATPPQTIDLRIEMNDAAFLAEGTIALNPRDSGTDVSWRLGGELGRDPFARINRTLLQRAVGETLQANLDRLKQAAVQPQPDEPVRPTE